MSNHLNRPWSNPLTRFFALIAFIAILLSSCGSSAATPSAPSFEAPANAPMPAMEAEGGGSVGRGLDTDGAYQPGSGEPAADVERLVIKNASVQLVVADPQKSLQAISTLAESMGGWVVSANLYQRTLDNGAEAPFASVTVRVPAERLNEALERIRSESDQEPISETVSSEDVTKQYTDLNSQLRNLEATEVQLTRIMESATETTDVLSVYQELTRVRGEIEVIKGQIQYYEQSARMSSISIELSPNEAVQPLRVGRWEIGGVAKDAFQALLNTVEFFVYALIWLVILGLPMAALVYLFIVLPFRLARRYLRNRRSRPAPPTTPAPQA